MEKNRILYLDVLKVMAIIMIVVCHTAEFISNDAPYKDIVYMIADHGVPLFVMITGVLSINKFVTPPQNTITYCNKTIAFYKRNVLQIWITGVIWIIAYYVMTADGLTLSGIIKCLLLINKPAPHLWYIRMILMYFVLMPAICYLLVHRKWIVILIVLSSIALTFAWNAVSIIEGEQYPTRSGGPSMYCYIVYLLAAYYINKGVLRKIRLSIVCFAFVMVFALLYVSRIQNNYFLWYDNPIILVSSLLLFEIVRRIVLHSGRENLSYVTTIAKMSFGIYLSHFVVVMYFPAICNSLKIELSANMQFLISSVVALFLSIVVIALIKKCSPMLSKVLFRY